MSDLGLRYGEEFRPIRELSAGAGRSAGRVALSDVIARRAGEYALHPVLFDGALQVFSAGAATVEDRQARMKLPVRFARILFLGSPGASSRVRARVQEFSDDFLEGDIALYDEAGKPCVLVDGFRAISVAGAGRSAPGSTRDLTYHVAWERTPSDVVRPALRAASTGAIARGGPARARSGDSVRGRSELEAAIRAVDELAAAQLARGLREMGVTRGIPFDADTLRVAAPMRRAFERLAAGLVKHGVLAKKEDRWEPAPGFAEAADSAEDVLRSYIEKHPGHLPEALLCEGNCAELGAILRGEKDAVQVLFSGIGADLLEQFYGDGLFTSQWLGSHRGRAGCGRATSAGRTRIAHSRNRRGHRRTGLAGIAAPRARFAFLHFQRRLRCFLFWRRSKSSPRFRKWNSRFSISKNRAWSRSWKRRRSTSSSEPTLLHAVSDVRAALRNLHDLLAPGGSLIFMDTATPQLWTETVFGLTSGWWRFTDRDLRPEQPLLERAQWEMVLRETGFSETMSLPGLIGPTGGEGQIGLLARKAWTGSCGSRDRGRARSAGGKIVAHFRGRLRAGRRVDFAASRSRVRAAAWRAGRRFRVRLEPTPSRCARKRSRTGKSWLKHVRRAPPERIVYLWNLDAPQNR